MESLTMEKWKTIFLREGNICWCKITRHIFIHVLLSESHLITLSLAILCHCVTAKRA